MTKQAFRIPFETRCSISSCGRKATRYLNNKNRHKYLCDCCHRAYVLGRAAGYHTKQREK